MKKTMIILITLLIVILFISFNKSSKEEIVIKDDNKIDLMIKEIKEEKPNLATVVLKKSEDYLPPVPEVKEIQEESYFYEGRIISKEEYLRLNINEDVNLKDLVTDENEFSFDNVDAALKDLAPEPIKVKKILKKKASNTPDLNDLFN